MATNLADAAVGHMLAKDVLQLHTLVTKYGRVDGVAYAVIQDRDGRVLANSLGTVGTGLEDNLASDPGRKVSGRSLTLQGNGIYDSREPILEGQLGTARIGIWAERIKQETNRVSVFFIGSIAVVFVASITIAVLLAARLIRPWRRLIEVAGKISTGDLDTPVRVEARDEFGELTHSLERMRASLRAAMMRLDQRNTEEQQMYQEHKR
jgi:methyl-accepting chemotaxis protein